MLVALGAGLARADPEAFRRPVDRLPRVAFTA